MIYTLLLLLLCCIIAIIILVIRLNKRTNVLRQVVIEKHDIEVLRKDEIKEYFKEEWEKGEQELNSKLEQHNKWIEAQKENSSKTFELLRTENEAKLTILEAQLKEKEKRYNEVNQDLELYKKGKFKEIDDTAAEYEKRKRLEIDNVLEQAKRNANSNFETIIDGYSIQKAQLEAEIETIKSELEEERSRRAAINEEILRQRKLEEQQDFYRIQLNDADANDIEILRSVTARLQHPEAINKVIWSGYYQKPLAELRKRLLTNGDISGVYKITRMKTNEIYIGQSVSLDKRFQEHVKTALGVGTLASSQLHRVMRADGCENFTFEVLEEVPKEKLRERESYYIDFYDSKTYGLNSVTGDKK